MATVAIVGLLLALRLVVREAVQQADLRHKASAERNSARWRCNGLRGTGARDSCLAQLNRDADAPPLAQDFATNTVVELVDR
jgi:hypothetical protein